MPRKKQQPVTPVPQQEFSADAIRKIIEEHQHRREPEKKPQTTTPITSIPRTPAETLLAYAEESVRQEKLSVSQKNAVQVFADVQEQPKFSDITPADFEKEFRIDYPQYDDREFLKYFWDASLGKREKLWYILCCFGDGTAIFDVFENRIRMSDQEELQKLLYVLSKDEETS